MAIALRASAGGTATSGTLAVTVPAGTAAGDVLLIDVTVSASSAVPATPSGLTLLDSGSSGPSLATYCRVCDGTEPASYSFTISATASGTSRSYTGVDNVSPINAHGAPNRLTTTGNATANSITTTVNGCMLVFCAGNSANSASFTNPSGFGNQTYRHTSGQSNATVSCDGTQTIAGATGSVTGTFSLTSSNTYASLIALAPSSAIPINTVAPAVTGSVTMGQTLSTTNGTWTDDGSPTYSYQWQRETGNGTGVYTNIASATSSTYTTTTSDLGFLRIRCQVTDSTPDGNATASSNAVGPIQNHINLGVWTLVAVADIVAEWQGSPSNTVAPAVTGTIVVGQTLTTTNGTWSGSPTSYAYQWQRDSQGDLGFINIVGATSSTYTLVDADDGCDLQCVVTGTNGFGNASANSNFVGLVTEPVPSNSVAPATSGTPSVGVVVSVTNGTWANMGGITADFSYQWQNSPSPFTTWSNITSATLSTYGCQATDVSKKLRCVVTATNSGGSASANSNATTAVVSSGGLGQDKLSIGIATTLSI